VLFRAVREDTFEQVVVLVHGWCFRPFPGRANLAAGTSDRHADSASHNDYTRKNDHPLRKRQGAEPASRPSPISLICMD
jgi:hypothetical protein